ncbi:WD repeat-containing protein 76 [Aplochiton taeniatus]
MVPVNLEESSGLPPEFLKLCTEDSVKVKKVDMSLKEYQTTLKSMHMPNNGVVKVVRDRIFSAAFHPCGSNLLMAAGDKYGRVGLWKLVSLDSPFKLISVAYKHTDDSTSGFDTQGGECGDDGVLLFEPHTRPVGCMAFSRSSPANLLTSSYDGSLRSMDVEKAAFDDVYSIEDGIKNFDFLSHDCSTLMVGDWYGDVAIVDRRTPGNTYESLYTLDYKAVRCVNVHPVQKHYFVVAETKVVSIYDTRFLKRTSSQAVSQLHGHTLSINSAYFSPVTGNRVLTCCYDNNIRIYDTAAMTTTAPLLTSIRHNMQTGRWLSKLTAVWDPKQEDCFLVGSMGKPRCAQVFHESGQLQHTFRDMDLSTVVSVTAFHPSRNAMLGGNSSGRLHIFTD